MKKIVEDFKRDDFDPTFPLGSTIIVETKEDGTYRSVVDYRGLDKQIEKCAGFFPQINKVIG